MKKYTVRYAIVDTDSTNLEEMYEVFDNENNFLGYIPWDENEKSITNTFIESYLNL